MEIVEVQIPLTVEDFEIGDRVYFLNHKHDIIEYGTITALLDPIVQVIFEKGIKRPVHVTQFGAGGWVGRCFPIEQLEVGSVVSVFNSGERIYADILEFVPGKIVRLKYRSDGKEALMTQSPENGPLEFQMACYALEG